MALTSNKLCASCLKRETCPFFDYIKGMVECSSYELGCHSCYYNCKCRVYRSRKYSTLNESLSKSMFKPMCCKTFTFCAKFKSANEINFLTGELL